MNQIRGLISLLTEKAHEWQLRVANQIEKHKNATLGDWVVLGPVLSDPLKTQYYLTKVPLYLHIAGAICCLGFSATFHLFKDHSLQFSESLARLDYAGISLMIAGSNMPPLYYSFYCQPVHCKQIVYDHYSLEELLHNPARSGLLDSVCDVIMV